MKSRKPAVGLVALFVCVMLPSIACAANTGALPAATKGNAVLPVSTPVSSTTSLFELAEDSRALWLEHAPWGNPVPARQLVLSPTIRSFWALDENTVYVVDGYGDLWWEHGPWGPSRTFEEIDQNVRAYWPLDTNHAYVLDENGKLFYERGPWAAGASGQLVAENVDQFQAMGPDNVYVLDTSHKLWLDVAPSGTTFQTHIPVDTNVQTFQALNLNAIYVEDFKGNLTLEQSSSLQTTPLTHQLVDQNVADLGRTLFSDFFQAKPFQALGLNSVYVEDRNSKLWLDQGTWGTLNRTRGLVGTGVNSFQATDDHTVYVVDDDLKLWLYQGPWGSGTYHQLVNDSDLNSSNFVLEFQPVQAVMLQTPPTLVQAGP